MKLKHIPFLEIWLKTASDNVYLIVLSVLLVLNNYIDTCTKFRFHSSHILKAGGGILVVFQNHLATMNSCRNAC